jgi:hypothetical protein
MASDDEDRAHRLVRDSLAHAAECARPVESAAAEDEQVRRAGGVDECVDGLPLVPVELVEAAKALDVDGLALPRHNRAHRDREAVTELPRRIERAQRDQRAVDADCDRRRKLVERGRSPREQHRASGFVEQGSGRAPEHDARRPAVAVAAEAIAVAWRRSASRRRTSAGSPSTSLELVAAECSPARVSALSAPVIIRS